MRTPIRVGRHVIAVMALGWLAMSPALHAQATQSNCTTGIAVENSAGNPGLVADCEELLGAKEQLAGTGTLNWSAEVAMSSWDGVTTGGTPSRVTKLRLRVRGLNGGIPSELGNLTKLTSLDLGFNDLSGEIPSELGNLTKLTGLSFSSNDLCCIPK